MSDTHETIAAILAEMRKAGRSDEHADGPLIEDYAERIEAAAARERNAHIKDIHDALYKATGIPGNAAAMRAALEWVAEFVELGVDDEYSTDGENLQKAAERARAALAAPTRNCDRFQTEEEAYAAFMGLFDHFKGERHYQYCRWLFAPTEGADHA